MTPRTFVFSAWVGVGKTAAATISALETVAAGNFTTSKEGGKMLTSVSTGGKSYSFQLGDPSSTPSSISALAYSCWVKIRLMDDATLTTWLTSRESKSMQVQFIDI